MRICVVVCAFIARQKCIFLSTIRHVAHLFRSNPHNNQFTYQRHTLAHPAQLSKRAIVNERERERQLVYSSIELKNLKYMI